ncbi:MAG: hypothetical protein R6V62_01370 [Candidatus Fermentibacteraceae bacterium]
MMFFALVLATLTGVQGNLELTEQAVFQAVTPVADALSLRGTESLFITVEGAHEGGWLVVQALTNLLSEKGIGVTAERTDRTGSQIVVRPMQLGVVYGEIERSWFLGARRMPRSAVCSLAISLLDENGIVVDTWRTEGLVQDTVSPGDKQFFEHRTELWANDTVPAGSGNKVLEPVVVTGVVAALIYLFYSSRAD